MYHVACKRAKGVFASLRSAILWLSSPKSLALAVAAAILAGCTNGTRVVRFRYVAPIMSAHTMPESMGRTRCSVNNLPIVEIDSVVLASYPINVVTRAHEQVHVDSAVAHQGGCWAYMYRIRDDKAFRIQQQLAAYCNAARVALEHNGDPRHVWMYVQAAMAPDTVLTAKDNCVYRPW